VICASDIFLWHYKQTSFIKFINVLPTKKKAYECYKKDDRSSRSTMVTFKSLTRNVSCIKQFIPYDLTGKRHQIERIHENQINEISKKIKVPYPESIFM
jgi:hypothetical protein